jgi:hypothetical protein
MSVQNQGMLVKVKVKMWTATKVDREVGERAASMYDADPKSGSYHKKLIDPKALKGIRSVRTRIRDVHSFMTRYWDDDGTRLAVFSTLDEYKQSMAALSAEMQDEIAEFKNQFPSHVRDAQEKMKEMFNPDEYPTVDELDNLFGVSVEYAPIPSGEFVPMSAPDRDLLVAQVEKTTTERLSEGTQNLFFRLRNQLNGMRKLLASYAENLEAGDRANLSSAMFANLTELVDVLPLLNITDDKFLEKAIARVKEEFAEFNIEALRGNVEVAKKIAGDLGNVLADIPE